LFASKNDGFPNTSDLHRFCSNRLVRRTKTQSVGPLKSFKCYATGSCVSVSSYDDWTRICRMSRLYSRLQKNQVRSRSINFGRWCHRAVILHSKTTFMYLLADPTDVVLSKFQYLNLFVIVL
jgi:hypothetical protein